MLSEIQCGIAALQSPQSLQKLKVIGEKLCSVLVLALYNDGPAASATFAVCLFITSTPLLRANYTFASSDLKPSGSFPLLLGLILGAASAKDDAFHQRVALQLV